MMNVKDYASDTNHTVAEVLKKCKELSIKASKAEDLLSEDDVVMLDITLASDNIEDEESNILVEDDQDIVSSNIEITINDDIKQEKLKKKSDFVSSKKEFDKQKKELYKHKEKLMTNKRAEDDVILYKEGMTVASLAEILGVSGTEIVKKLMELGMMVAVNQAVDYEAAEIIASEYKKKLKKEETQDISNFEQFEIVDDEANLVKRAPVVTIMGHVDHGKTTLLDYIRSSHIVDKESGGITQAIGAYQIKYHDEKITFIDTPGHAAFTEMRARGASVTDIVVIVVAADDGVMPQTKEAVDHALAAKVPIIVAVNKIDKPNINEERVMTEMAALNITPESWGGTIPFVRLSAKTGEGVDLLLDTIVAIGDMLELKANPSRYALGTVIESRSDKNVGSVAALLIQNGTLRVGDPIVVGTCFGNIRTMKDDNGNNILEALPSAPVEVTGINGVPSAGDKFMAFEKAEIAKEIANKRLENIKQTKYRHESLTLDDLFAGIQSGIKEINVVLKTDVRGSEEAVKNSLEKIDVEGVKVKVIRSGVGNITESDIVLASASNAIIIGFNVIPDNNTKGYAKDKGVEIRLYTIIYKLVEEMELAMKGMLDPEFEEKELGKAIIRKIFKFSKVGSIAGSYVTDGIIKNNSSVRVVRDGNVIFEGKIGSVQREKDQVKEVKAGLECGITIANFSDLKEGDIFQTYEIVEVKK